MGKGVSKFGRFVMWARFAVEETFALVALGAFLFTLLIWIPAILHAFR